MADVEDVTVSAAYTAVSSFMVHCAKGNLKKVKSALVENDTLAHARDENGLLPIHVSSLHGKTDVVKHLIEKCDVNIDALSTHSWTPLHMVINPNTNKDSMLKCLNYLLDNGANVNAVNEDGTTACHLAASDNMIEALRVLVRKHANVMLKNSKGQLPLDIARLRSFKDCVRVLMNTEWGTSDEYYHNEVRKLALLKQYRDEIQSELDIITVYQNDLNRKEDFTSWLKSKELEGKGGPPNLSTKELDVERKEVLKTHDDVFGDRYRPPKAKHAICDVCGRPETGKKKVDQVKLPDLKAHTIETTLYGKVKSKRNPYQSNSVLDNQRLRPVKTQDRSSDIGSIIRDYPTLPKGREIDSGSSQKSLMSMAASVPITWKGKPSTVKDYLLEKSYIC